MLVSENEQLKQDIRTWSDTFGHTRAALMPILQEIQKKYTWISPYAMQVVADLLDIHPVEVYSVISFYSFLHDSPRGSFVIRLCRTISCEMAGKQQIARSLENELGIEFGETTPDGRFTLEWTNCLGMCDQGPAMMVNEQVFTRVTPDRVLEILDNCRKTFGVFALQGRRRIE